MRIRGLFYTEDFFFLLKICAKSSVGHYQSHFWVLTKKIRIRKTKFSYWFKSTALHRHNKVYYTPHHTFFIFSHIAPEFLKKSIWLRGRTNATEQVFNEAITYDIVWIHHSRNFILVGARQLFYMHTVKAVRLGKHLIISCLKVKIKCFILVTHASTRYMHTIYGGAIHFGLALWVTRARAQALTFCHDGALMKKRFEFFDVTAFFLRMAFWLLTEENGSCPGQLPHAPFKIKKSHTRSTSTRVCYF